MLSKIVKIDEASPDTDLILRSADVLKQGGMLVFPTETVYGIGVDAFNTDAVRNLYEKKQRPFDKPLLMHISSLEMAESLAVLDDSVRDLIRRYTPGPLTLVVKRKESLPSIAVSGGDTVGLRFPSNQLFIELSKAFGAPIAATSANISGCKSATNADELSSVMAIADMVIDGGECEFGLESTIVSLVGERPKILRQGAFSRDMIEEVLGKCD